MIPRVRLTAVAGVGSARRAATRIAATGRATAGVAAAGIASSGAALGLSLAQLQHNGRCVDRSDPETQARQRLAAIRCGRLTIGWFLGFVFDSH